jgi:carbonic anhydrase
MKKINNFISITTLAALMTLSGCTAITDNPITDRAKKVKEATSHKAHWGYTGHTDPSHWGELSPKYAECAQGKNQSPINIVVADSKDTNLQDIVFSYNATSNSVVNNGHTIQVNIDDGSAIMIDGKRFELKQFHFHTPSENQIDGKHFPLEAHFVHLDKEGNIAVLALMFEEGKSNTILEKIWSKMPANADDKSALTLSSDDIHALLPKENAYYRFSGSLTTPPCSEGVRWFVLKTAVNISKEQVEKFLHTMHHANNRPVQNINARKVLQ